MPIVMIECLGRSNRRVFKRPLHQPKKMNPVQGHDLYKCPVCGFHLTGQALVKGVGENEYWRTAEDLGNSGTNWGASNFTGLSGYSSSTTTNTPISSSTLNQVMYKYYGSQVAAAFHYTVNSLNTSEHIPLPVEKRNDPIRAWRWANDARVHRGVVVFEGVTGPLYAADDRAICLAHPDVHHWSQIPLEHCRCGFHGMKAEHLYREEAGDGHYPILLQVEFYGRVIEGEYGYRAQHQRVLDIFSDKEYDLPGFRLRPMSEVKEEIMKIRFADGEKVIEIETSDDMPLILSNDSLNVGWNVDESEVEED